MAETRRYISYHSHLAPLYRVRIDGGDVVGVVVSLTFYTEEFHSATVS
jgi:hypothetical protein